MTYFYAKSVKLAVAVALFASSAAWAAPVRAPDRAGGVRATQVRGDREQNWTGYYTTQSGQQMHTGGGGNSK
jgi:hypothetical protein